MARSQQSLEETKMELSRMKNTLRFTKEDHLNIQNQLKHKTETLSTLESQLDTLKYESQNKIKELTQKLNELTNEKFKLCQQIEDYKIKLELKTEQEINEENENENENDELLSNSNSNSNINSPNKRKKHKKNVRKNRISINISDNEGQIQELATRLLEKQNMLDELISKNRQLSLELKEYKLNTNNLRNQISTLQKTIAIHSGGGVGGSGGHSSFDIEKGNISGIGVRGMMLKQRRIGSATPSKTINYGLSILDSLGIQLGLMLRGRPWMRLLIVFYIIVLHLFVFVVLYSHHNQIHDDHYNQSGLPLANSIVARP